MYQVCTEFGWFQIASDPNEGFGDIVPLDFFIDFCKDAFDPQFNVLSLKTAIEKNNKIYGGLDINVYNVIFVYGLLDPWHKVGVYEKKHKNYTTTIIPSKFSKRNLSYYVLFQKTRF